jgi:TPP-dependent pyruvate/acetoin dehydrogenase alpha subunit
MELSRVAEPVALVHPWLPEKTQEALAGEFYRQMYLIRRFEERALGLFSKGLLNGTVHTCIGQECCCVGVVNALDKQRDVVVSNHRGHGHYLALTDDVEGLAAEIMGRARGTCGGVGGSQHLHRGHFYSNGIQGGIVPVATGMALAEKEKGSGAIAAVVLGDGTFGQGVIYESFNIASKWSLPVLYVVENNGYAQSTPVAVAHAGRLDDRLAAFGIPGAAMAADDVLAVHTEAQHWVERVRSEQRPAFLLLETYRLAPHSKGDDTRPEEEVARHRRNDPLPRFAGRVEAALRARIETSVDDRLEEAIAAATAMPAQDFAEYRQRMVAGGIYAP